jgi:hypothetical protein
MVKKCTQQPLSRFTVPLLPRPHLVDEINYQAKQVKKPARNVLNDWLLQQENAGDRLAGR